MADILIVDDSRQFCDLIQELLAQIDYVTIVCATTYQALPLVEQYRPSIILVNQTAPDDRNIGFLLEHIQQIDPTSVCVSIPLCDHFANDLQETPSALDSYLAEFCAYRVAHPADPSRMAETINVLQA